MVYLQNNIIKNLKYEKDQIGILEMNNVTEMNIEIKRQYGIFSRKGKCVDKLNNGGKI